MQRYLAALTIVLLLGMVLTRVMLMKRKGIRAMYFGSIDKKDFLIPPFALFYFYVIFAAAFHSAGVFVLGSTRTILGNLQRLACSLIAAIPSMLRSRLSWLANSWSSRIGFCWSTWVPASCCFIDRYYLKRST